MVVEVDVLLHSIRQLVAPRNALQDNVLIPNARGLERLLRSVEQRIDDLRVPARMYDTNPQTRS
jgi:hypothetical protein